ncbi:MAG: EAL domain-containing protein, partial [Gammaproteobacteria bacterium]|nr:EAL domain-containing protein [Gammaproteobacteria bacterium]
YRDANTNSGYFMPLRLVEPMTPENSRLLGVDAYSTPSWVGTIQEAVLSGRTRLQHGSLLTGTGNSLLAFKPTYFGVSGDVEPHSRQSQNSGLFVLSIELDRLFARALEGYPDLRLELLQRPPAGGEGALRHGTPSLDEDWRVRLVDVQTVSLHDTLVRVQVSQSAHWTTLLSPSLISSIAIALILAASVTFAVSTAARARRQREQIIEQQRLAAVTLECIADPVVRIDPQGRITYLNPAAEALIGLDSDSARSRALDEVLPFTDERGEPVSLPGPYAAQRPGPGEQVLTLARHEAGQVSQFSLSSSLVKSSHDTDLGQVFALRDVTRERQLATQLQHQAHHDPLTGLPNRRAFEQAIEIRLATLEKTPGQHALCYLDLDQFKIVNDTCGHVAGDELLRRIAPMLRRAVRATDIVARLGGDEFGLLIADCDEAKAVELCTRVCEQIERYRFSWEERAFAVGVSIGLVMLDNAKGSPGELQKCADLACYAAKRGGRNRVHVFREDDSSISSDHQAMHWQVEIRNALDENRFTLFAQPIVPLHDFAHPRLLKELLIRMRSRDGELIQPFAFLPAGERFQAMPEIDMWVIEQGIRHLASENHSDTVYSINLSGQTLGVAQLATTIRSHLRRYAVSPRRLCFEITESAAIANIDLAAGLISDLRREGVSFALDDFGSGLSSFGYLKQLPIDLLKIDGQFVRDVVRDPYDRTMVSCIRDIAHVMRVHTVAEKVPNQQTIDCLRDMGIDFVQGFIVGKPQPLGLQEDAAPPATAASVLRSVSAQ